jgi:hypothetical protein
MVSEDLAQVFILKDIVAYTLVSISVKSPTASLKMAAQSGSQVCALAITGRTMVVRIAKST